MADVKNERAISWEGEKVR